MEIEIMERLCELLEDNRFLLYRTKKCDCLKKEQVEYRNPAAFEISLLLDKLKTIKRHKINESSV